MCCLVSFREVHRKSARGETAMLVGCVPPKFQRALLDANVTTMAEDLSVYSGNLFQFCVLVCYVATDSENRFRYAGACFV